MTLEPGLHVNVPMRDYLSIDALGSTRLHWLDTSPLHYQHMLGQYAEDTDATRRGIALHMAVLEPQLFMTRYAPEPDLQAIGGAKPRATNAYRDAVAQIEKGGQMVMREPEMALVLGMAVSIRNHPHAARLLKRADGREVTALWTRGDRLCRGRFDMLGDDVIVDVKTTRNLKRFSPWVITQFGYHVQAAWYRDGRRRLGGDAKHYFLVAVESSPPFDVGVFVLDQFVLDAGMDRCDALVAKLDECERSGVWPGQFPDIVQANIAEVTNGESDEEAA